MSTEPQITLRKHHLKHLPELKVHENILSLAFTSGCSMMKCDATCCHGGVYADLSERDRILAHTELILRHMEPQQEKDPSRWFDDDVVEDTDFPSGAAIGTQINERGCIFLKANGYCVLQVAATAEGMGKFALKPFFCVAFPVTISEGELMLDDPDYTERTQCCSSVSGGTLTVLDVCAEELEHVLGKDGVEELRPHIPVPQE